jgi:hypothetical protein
MAGMGRWFSALGTKRGIGDQDCEPLFRDYGISLDAIYYTNLLYGAGTHIVYHGQPHMISNLGGIPPQRMPLRCEKLASGVLEDAQARLKHLLGEPILTNVKDSTQLDIYFLLLDIFIASRIGADLVLTGSPPKIETADPLFSRESALAVRQFYTQINPQRSLGVGVSNISISETHISSLEAILNSKLLSDVYDITNTPGIKESEQTATLHSAIDRLIASTTYPLRRYSSALSLIQAGAAFASVMKIGVFAPPLAALLKALFELQSEAQKTVKVTFEQETQRLAEEAAWLHTSKTESK